MDFRSTHGGMGAYVFFRRDAAGRLKCFAESVNAAVTNLFGDRRQGQPAVHHQLLGPLHSVTDLELVRGYVIRVFKYAREVIQAQAGRFGQVLKPDHGIVMLHDVGHRPLHRSLMQ